MWTTFFEYEKEYISAKIRVNAVCPGLIENEAVTNFLKNPIPGVNIKDHACNPMIGPNVS